MVSSNPFAQSPRPEQITVEAAPALLDVLEVLCEDIALATTRYVDAVTPHVILLVDASDVAVAEALIAGAEPKHLTRSVRVMRLEEIDWVAQVQKDFPPFSLGRFYVYGSHINIGDTMNSLCPQCSLRNHFPLLIDAVSAFGTGEHATTAGCLVALEMVKKTWKNMPVSVMRRCSTSPFTGEVASKRRVGVLSAFNSQPPSLTLPARGREYGTRGEERAQHREFCITDVGCGTAILAIGAARLWKNARITACDNDAVAVRVSRHNLKVNRIAARAKAHISDGYKMRSMQRAGKQEVIVANILARPLMRMAKDAARQLAPGGTLILSGLLNTQENMVLSAHRAQGLYLKRKLRRGAWSVLVVG